MKKQQLLRMDVIKGLSSELYVFDVFKKMAMDCHRETMGISAGSVGSVELCRKERCPRKIPFTDGLLNPPAWGPRGSPTWMPSRHGESSPLALVGKQRAFSLHGARIAWPLAEKTGTL